MQDFEVKIGGGLTIEVGLSARHYGIHTAVRTLVQFCAYTLSIKKFVLCA